MNKKQMTVYNALMKHAKGYKFATMNMIQTNATFFQAYNGFRLSNQEEGQVINEFIANSKLVISQ